MAAPQQWATKTNAKLSGLQAFRNDALMSRPSGNNIEKTSLPLISKLDSDGDSPNCSDDDVAIGASDDFLTAIGAKDSQVIGASSGRGSASKKDLTGMMLGGSPLVPSQS